MSDFLLLRLDLMILRAVCWDVLDFVEAPSERIFMSVDLNWDTLAVGEG